MLKNVKKLLSKSMSGKRLVIFVTSFVAFSTVIGFVAYKSTQASVSLTVDGQKVDIDTHAKTVGDLLRREDIELSKRDYLSHSLSAPVTENMNVVWKPAKSVQLVVDEQKQHIWTTADTVNEVLKEQEMELSKHDQIQPSLDTAIKQDLAIEIDKAFQVTLNEGENQQQVWSTSTTVADFLEQQEINLNDPDRVDPSLSSQVTPGSVVNVIRVKKVTDVVEEPVDYATVTKNDPNLEKGKEKIIQEGQKGRVTKHYEVTLENGKETSRKLVKTEEQKESKDKVLAVGSKVVKPVTQTAAKVDTQVSRSNGGSVSKEFTVNSTAYTAYCNGCSGKTRTGFDLRANPNAKVIAVDPNVIPLGSKVYVEGYGYAVAADTGGAIKGHKIDVFFPDKSKAYRWGRRTVKIKVLN
ncbi:ubiquitin-like domain-containing protein [Bacillus sp. CGMCC 1.16541]|uniref:ubiquitin-like domain-containing protein n=1 Tax=Bacillus sp. CGMCC 1.16541 TaxID=2185143 RepID=UPI0031B9ECAF